MGSARHTERSVRARTKAANHDLHGRRCFAPPGGASAPAVVALRAPRSTSPDPAAIWTRAFLDWTTQAIGQQHTSPLRAGCETRRREIAGGLLTETETTQAIVQQHNLSSGLLGSCDQSRFYMFAVSSIIICEVCGRPL